MKRVLISDYQVPAPEIAKEMAEFLIKRGWTPPANERQGDTDTMRYAVKGSLLSLLFGPELRIQAKDLLERDKLAHKLDDCKDDTVLLEDAEYNMIHAAVEAAHGFGRNDVELVKRVYDAETVTVKVQEKPREDDPITPATKKEKKFLDKLGL